MSITVLEEKWKIGSKKVQSCIPPSSLGLVGATDDGDGGGRVHPSDEAFDNPALPEERRAETTRGRAESLVPSCFLKVTVLQTSAAVWRQVSRATSCCDGPRDGPCMGDDGHQHLIDVLHRHLTNCLHTCDICTLADAARSKCNSWPRTRAEVWQEVHNPSATQGTHVTYVTCH